MDLPSKFPMIFATVSYGALEEQKRRDAPLRPPLDLPGYLVFGRCTRRRCSRHAPFFTGACSRGRSLSAAIASMESASIAVRRESRGESRWAPLGADPQGRGVADFPGSLLALHTPTRGTMFRALGANARVDDRLDGFDGDGPLPALGPPRSHRVYDSEQGQKRAPRAESFSH